MLIVEDGVAAGAFKDLLRGKGSVAAWNDAPTEVKFNREEEGGLHSFCVLIRWKKYNMTTHQKQVELAL